MPKPSGSSWARAGAAGAVVLDDSPLRDASVCSWVAFPLPLDSLPLESWSLDSVPRRADSSCEDVRPAAPGTRRPAAATCSWVSQTAAAAGSVRSPFATYGPPPVTLTSLTIRTTRSQWTR